MECFIAREADIELDSRSFVLKGDEARHAIRVLRLREGEKLLATTLNGFCYAAKLSGSEQLAKNDWIAYCAIEEILPEHNEPDIDIQLIQGIPQHQSKLEEIVEKITEIGIRSILPIYSKRTEKKTINSERLIRILQNACKQSYRARMPVLADVMSFEEGLAKALAKGRKIIILHESAPLRESLSKALENNKNSKISLVVGPEGGFDEEEIVLANRNHEVQIASLGPRRLRAETAAVMAVSLALGI